jgi:CBS domain-containing protein
MAHSISDVMTATPKRLGARESVAEAARLMRERDIGDILVEKNGKTVGIVTDRDIVVRAIAAGKDPKATPLEDVCSSNLVSVRPDDSIDDAIRLMRERAIRRLPVMDGDEAVGIVSLGDLAVERDRSSVLGQVSAASPNR